MRRTLAALVVALVAAGCGSGGTTVSETPTSTPATIAPSSTTASRDQAIDDAIRHPCDVFTARDAREAAGWKVEPRADEIGPAGDNPVSSCFYEDRDANSGGSYASVALAPKPCDGNASRTRASIRRRLRAADVPSRRLSAAGMRDGEAFSIAEAIPDLNFGPLTEAFFEAGAYCVTVQIPNTVADPNALLDRVERAAVTVAGRL